MIFTQPAFLWGLLAIALPVIIHLFNFRRYRKVYFSNVEHLSELLTEQRRRSNVRQWLVLAARVLGIAMIVMAFSQPVIPSPEATVRTGSTAVSIYVDNSFSMDNATAEGSLLDEARRRVREIAEAYAPGDRFQLVTNDLRGSEMRWLSREELLTALDEVALSAAAPLMSTVATRQQAFLHQSGTQNQHLYLVGDFQQSTADLEALPADSSVLTTLVPLSAVEADNLYIDTVVPDAPAYFAGGSVNLEVTLRNSGSRDAEQVPVRLFIDGHERALTTVDVAADGSAKALLRFSIDHGGWIDGCVTIEDYPVVFDDRYHFTFHVGDRLRMLEIDGREPNECLERLFAHDSTISYQQARQLQHELTDYDIVILNEPKTLASGEVQQLAQWVDEGGSLLVIPAEQAAPGLNELLASLQAPRLERWVSRTVKANSIDYANKLFSGVFNGHSDEMEMPSVQGHHTLSSGPAIKQAVLTLADGGELLTVTPAGRGRLYLFTTPLDAAHTDLVGQALVVPTLYNMALYSRPLPPASHTLGTTGPIALQGRYDATDRPPELSNGETTLLPDLRRQGQRWQLLLHGELADDGIYTLADEHLAFNYPRRESQMTFLGRSEIERAISGREDVSLVAGSAKPLTDVLKARDGGRRLWRLCLVLALLALAVETILLKTKP